MLKQIKSRKPGRRGGAFAIVASRYNGVFVDGMLRAAKAELQRAGAKVRIVRVPGAFEIPAVAARLAAKSSSQASASKSHGARYSGIICLGVIFQGETAHAQHIGWGVTHALAQIQVLYHVPVVHGVFLFEKQKQARVRCLEPKHNRGTETARTALEMARVMGSVR